MTRTTLTHAQLRISPLNVRTNQEDATSTDALAASILEHGLLNPLDVHPFVQDRGKSACKSDLQVFGVFAGGRRWHAIGQLIERGDLPADWPIDVLIRDDLTDAEITELSLSENILRRDLRPSEIHAAVARAADQGAGIDEIAANTGQSRRWVQQQLRLGRLAPEIFAAYEAGTIGSEEAQAYAATEDHALQLAAWTAMQGRPQWDRAPHRIRAFLKVDDRELARLLRLVGDDAYRAAGGRFELDLFADGPDRGRVVDEGLLRQLAEAEFEIERAATRIALGMPDLRYAAQPPQFAGHTDQALRIHDSGGRRGSLPRGAAPETVVGVLVLHEDGGCDTEFWWVSRKAKGDAEKSGAAQVVCRPVAAEAVSSPASEYGRRAREAVKEEHGLTADGLQIVRSLRRLLMRHVLFAAAAHEDPAIVTVPRDYLLWSQLRQAFGSHREADCGTRPLASTYHSTDDEPSSLIADFMADEPLAQDWNSLVGVLSRQPFMLEGDPARSLQLYVAQPEELKNSLAALLAAHALLRSANAPGWRIAAHDAVVDLIGADNAAVREFWMPNARFIGLLPRLKRLELAQAHVDPEAYASWPKLDDRALSGAVAGVLEHTEGWVHPLLAFPPVEWPQDGDQTEPDDGPANPNVNDQLAEVAS